MSLENEKKGLHNPIYPHTNDEYQKWAEYLDKQSKADKQQIWDNFIGFVSELKTEEKSNKVKQSKELFDTLYKNTIPNKNCNIIDGSGLNIDENFIEKMNSVQHIADNLKEFEIKNDEKPIGFVGYESMEYPKSQEELLKSKNYVNCKLVNLANKISNYIKYGQSHHAVITSQELEITLGKLGFDWLTSKEKELSNYCNAYLNGKTKDKKSEEEFYNFLTSMIKNSDLYNKPSEIKETYAHITYPPKIKKGEAFPAYIKAAKYITKLIKNKNYYEAETEVHNLYIELTPAAEDKILVKKEIELYNWCKYYLECYNPIIQSNKNYSHEKALNSQVENSITEKQQEIVDWCKQHFDPKAAQYVEQQFKNNKTDEAIKYIKQQLAGNGINSLLSQEETMTGIKSGKWGQPYGNPNKVIEKWKDLLKYDATTPTVTDTSIVKKNMYIEGKPYSYYKELPYTQKCDILQELQKKYKDLSASEIALYTELSTDVINDIKIQLAEQKNNELTTKIASSQEMLNNIGEDKKVATDIYWDKIAKKTSKIYKNQKSINVDTDKMTPEVKEEILATEYAPANVIKAVDNIFKSDPPFTNPPTPKPPTTKPKIKRRFKSLSDQELNVIKFSIQLCLANIEIPNTSDEKIIVKLTKEIETEETLRQEEQK